RPARSARTSLRTHPFQVARKLLDAVPSARGGPASMLPALKEDLRHGLRLLVRKPGFTALVLLALSLAIGANTAIFSLVDAVLFHPLRVPRADELWRVIPIHEHAAGWSYPAYLDLRRAPAVESLCAWSDASPVHLAPAAGRPRRVGAS